MDVRLNRDGLLNIISAAFLASAIGYSAIGVSTRGCAAPRLERVPTGVGVGVFDHQVEVALVGDLLEGGPELLLHLHR